MNFRYYIFSGDSWVECGYNSYSNWKGKKYKSPFNVLDDLNSGKIEVEEQKKKQYYASGMSLVDGKWQSCGWTIEADSFLEAACPKHHTAQQDRRCRVPLRLPHSR